MYTLDSAQLHLLSVSVDMITVYEYIQCQSCVSHKESVQLEVQEKMKSTCVSITQMNVVTGLTHDTHVGALIS